MKRRKFFKASTFCLVGGMTGLSQAASGEAQIFQDKSRLDTDHEKKQGKITNNKKYTPLNLMNPPAAQTDTSIALIWDKPENADEIQHFKVYMDGNLAGEVERSDFTVENLKPDTSYSFSVCAVLKDGSLSEKSNEVVALTRAKGKVFDITKYGAVGDGKTMNTKAIQKTIDKCIPGGVVWFPKGIFLSGALHLKSNMTLYISPEATLLGSPDANDYPMVLCRYEGLERDCYSSLLNGGELHGTGVENVVITGGGCIDGNGVKLYVSELKEPKGPRGRVICFRNSRNIYLYNFKEKRSPGWNMHFIYSSGISINNLDIFTSYFKQGVHNANGITPDSSRNMYIFNNIIASQDDCIDIKSGKDEEGYRIGKPSENIRITDCLFNSGSGVVIGSEMSGGIKNILVRDCVFNNTWGLASIKTRWGRGGVVENIRYENIRASSMNEKMLPNIAKRGALNIDCFYYHYEDEFDIIKPVDEGTPTLRNISLKNISLEHSSLHGIYIAGLRERLVTNVKIENVQAKGRFGFKAMNVEGLELKNVTAKAEEGDDYVLNNVKIK